MDSVLILIVTSLISGLITTIITLVYQKKLEKKRGKEELFKILMSRRCSNLYKERVAAINMVEVVYYDNPKVIERLHSFLNVRAETLRNSIKNDLMEDMYFKLLEEMAKSLGMEEIDWTNIKHACYLDESESAL